MLSAWNVSKPFQLITLGIVVVVASMVPSTRAFQQTDREIAHVQLHLSIKRIEHLGPQLRTKGVTKMARMDEAEGRRAENPNTPNVKMPPRPRVWRPIGSGESEGNHGCPGPVNSPETPPFGRIKALTAHTIGCFVKVWRWITGGRIIPHTGGIPFPVPRGCGAPVGKRVPCEERTDALKLPFVFPSRLASILPRTSISHRRHPSRSTTSRREKRRLRPRNADPCDPADCSGREGLCHRCSA